MTQSYRVAVIVGSLRKGSYSRKVAKALVAQAPDSLDLQFVEIGDLDLYNEDVEAAGAPEAWTRFRKAVGESDAVLFVTPEYNRSVPGLLKNAIDVGSRPWGQAVWNNKPAAIVSTSMGALGGFGANHHLRQMLSFFDMPLLGQPEAYVGNTPSLFDEDDALVNEGTKEFFGTFIGAFADLVKHAASRG